MKLQTSLYLKIVISISLLLSCYLSQSQEISPVIFYIKDSVKTINPIVKNEEIIRLLRSNIFNKKLKFKIFIINNSNNNRIMYYIDKLVRKSYNKENTYFGISFKFEYENGDIIEPGFFPSSYKSLSEKRREKLTDKRIKRKNKIFRSINKNNNKLIRSINRISFKKNKKLKASLYYR